MKSLIVVVFLFVVGAPAQTIEGIFVDSRDGNQYEIVELDGLKWFGENLGWQTEKSTPVSDSSMTCGQFYLVEDAFKVCPEGWRLPTESEMKSVIKLNKRGKINLSEVLHINPCGRIDVEIYSRRGEQNTFWIDAELVDGYIMHWHTFGDEHELHNHNVVNGRRQFPVRCVCELTD
jgi:hypothetical protein